MMTFEEMQAILAGIVASQAEIQANQRENQERMQARQDEIQQSIEADRQARAEAHSCHELEMAQIRNQNAETAAIANSNARAIEAATNQQAYDREQMNQLKELQANTQRQLVEFIRFVGDYGEITNRRLNALEDRQ
jgi:hypothetical protein